MLRSAISISPHGGSTLFSAWAGMTLLGLVALWYALGSAQLVTPFLVPPPLQVAGTAWSMILDGTLLHHCLTSFARVLGGFTVSAVIAVPLAALVGLSRPARHLAEPPLEFLRHIPPLALMPLLILWLGIGEAPKLAVIVLATFFPVFLGTMSGIANCDRRLVEVGETCGFSKHERVRHIVLPAALPSIVVGLRLGLGYSWRALVGAELIAASAGLGYMIVDAENLARTDIIFVGIFTIGLLGLLLDAAARSLLRRVAPWLREELDLGRP